MVRDSAAPTAASLIRQKRLLIYLSGMQEIMHATELEFVPKFLDVYAASNWANCIETRKSTSGMHIKLNDTLIKAFSRTQSTIALSSGEAEFTAISSGTLAGIWVRNFMREMGFDLEIRIHSDSQAAIGMASRIGPGRVKHLDIKTLFVQELVKNVVSIHKVGTEDNVSDLGTKYLPTARHPQLVGMAGLYQEGQVKDFDKDKEKNNNKDKPRFHSAQALPPSACWDSRGHVCLLHRG